MRGLLVHTIEFVGQGLSERALMLAVCDSFVRISLMCGVSSVSSFGMVEPHDCFCNRSPGIALAHAVTTRTHAACALATWAR